MVIHSVIVLALSSLFHIDEPFDGETPVSAEQGCTDTVIPSGVLLAPGFAALYRRFQLEGVDV